MKTILVGLMVLQAAASPTPTPTAVSDLGFGTNAVGTLVRDGANDVSGTPSESQIPSPTHAHPIPPPPPLLLPQTDHCSFTSVTLSPRNNSTVVLRD
jgi:hypothetical protein